MCGVAVTRMRPTVARHGVARGPTRGTVLRPRCHAGPMCGGRGMSESIPACAVNRWALLLRPVEMFMYISKSGGNYLIIICNYLNYLIII